MAVRGLKELQQFLSTLAPKIERNIMRGALRAGANVVKAEAQNNLASRKKTGLLAKGLKVSTKAKGGTVTATVKAKGKHAHVAHWIEHGTKAHTIKPKSAKALGLPGGTVRSVEHPGISPGPFLRPALDSSQAKVLKAVGEAIKKRLTKEGIDASGVEIESDSE